MNCYNCKHFDKNAPIHCYGTCELQDVDENPVNRYCNDTHYFGEPEGEYITTDAVLRKWDMGVPDYYSFSEWTDTAFECPEPNCGGVMQRNNMKVLTSNPPMYEYKCKKCGAIHYRFN